MVVAGLSSESDRERPVAEVLSRQGRIDVLVNNAGVGGTVAVEHEELERFRSSMEINVTALCPGWFPSEMTGQSIIVDGGWTAR